MDYKEIIEGLKDRPYDFIANNYYRLEREQLKDIILELLAQFEGMEYERVKKTLIENLLDCKDWESYIEEEERGGTNG